METQLSPSYLKGNSRHALFWPTLAWLLVSLAIQITIPPLQHSLLKTSGFGSAFGVSLGLVALLAVGWVVLYAFYARQSTIPRLRVIFILLACGQLLGFAGSAFSQYSSMLMFNMSQEMSMSRFALASSMSFLFGRMTDIYCIVCLIVVACNRQCGAALRTAAILLAVFQFYALGYLALINLGAGTLASKVGSDAYMSLMTVLALCNMVASLALNIFFFASVAFTKPKPPKALPAPAGEPMEG